MARREQDGLQGAEQGGVTQAHAGWPAAAGGPAAGKRIGTCVYLHKSAAGQLPPELLARATARLPAGFSYDYLKYDRASGALTFTSVPGFDGEAEPVIGAQWRVPVGGPARFLPAPADPYILHGKHLLVAPDYPGFAWEEAAARFAAYQGHPALDKSRMGKKSWWEREFLPLLGQEPTPAMLLARANRSARGKGAVGAKPLVPRLVAAAVVPGTTVLDYGAGRPNRDGLLTGAELVRAAGGVVTAFDCGANFDPAVHAGAALGRQYQVVMASNVLNVQGSAAMLAATLAELAAALAPGGELVANVPASPVYYPAGWRGIEAALRERFAQVDLERHNGTRVYRCRAPFLAAEKS